MHLLPSTSKIYKRTYRHFFRRRMNQMERPLIVMTFQGVLGDFIKDGGISNKQDHLMSKHYLQAQASNASNSNSDSYSLWVRMGVVEGLKYLSKHFQIVVFNRDTCLEDLGSNHSQVQLIQQFLNQNDISIDAIYSSVSTLTIAQNQQQPLAKSENKESKTQKIQQQAQKPYKPNYQKQEDIWEDYKQIYLDFNFNTDAKIRDRVLFVNSLDVDYNARNEEVKMDSTGYFLLDVNSKPAKPLTQGLPITYDTGEKEIDLSDKGMFQFNGAKKEVQTKEMPVTILVPNPRSMYNQQLSFASIAKTIMTMCLMGRRKQKVPLVSQEDLLDAHLSRLNYLQEFDIKVQKE